MAGYDQYLSDIMAAIAQGQLQLQRDRFNQIELPTFQQISLPSSYTNLTGFLPGDYRGPYAGLAGWDALSGAVNMMGQVGGVDQFGNTIPGELDPRLAALGYEAGQKTLGGRQLDLQGDAQRAAERQWAFEFGAGRSDADRLFAEQQRVQLQQQAENDRAYALEIGVDPKYVVGGQVLPDYLRPHAEWAKQFAMGNQGRAPSYQDLVTALAPTGRTPEDYNGGRPYPGQVPAAGPGIVWDPARGGYLDTASGKVVMGTELQALVQQRQGQAPTMRMDANGNPVYGLPNGVGAQGIGATGPNNRGPTMGLAGGGVVAGAGNPLTAGLTMGPAPTGPGFNEGAPGPIPLAGGGEMISGAGYENYAGRGPSYPAPGGLMASPTNPLYGGLGNNAGGINLGGSGNTAAIGNGQPMSLDQRRLIEQGRTTDVQAQLTQRQQDLTAQSAQNDQRIREKEVEYRNYVDRGQLDLANRAQNELTDLNNRKFGLEQEIERGRLELDKAKFGLDVGQALGRYNGQSTVESQRLYGTSDTGQATLERENLYGGSAMVPSGVTAAERANQNQTTLGLLGLDAGLRGPADIVQYAKVVGGTPQGLRDVVDAAMGRYRNARYGDVGAGPQAATLDSMAGQATAGNTGSVAEVNQQMMRLGSPDQWSIQNVQNLAPTNRTMLTALAEGQGRRPEDIQNQFAQTLGRYRGPTRGRMAA